MARVCEICGRREDRKTDEEKHDIFDVCENCMNDRQTHLE